jgi:hypothetical protein
MGVGDIGRHPKAAVFFLAHPAASVLKNNQEKSNGPGKGAAPAAKSQSRRFNPRDCPWQ